MLRDLALSYVARFATSSGKLEAYLYRKIRERGVDEDAGELDVDAIVERIVELGYVDDALYAQSRANGLLNRGYGKRRVDEALRAAGVAEDIRDDVAPDEYAARDAAFSMARKRRFGPFGDREALDRPRREKQVAAMLRAGHSYAVAAALVDAQSIESAQRWLDEARED